MPRRLNTAPQPVAGLAPGYALCSGVVRTKKFFSSCNPAAVAAKFLYFFRRDLWVSINCAEIVSASSSRLNSKKRCDACASEFHNITAWRRRHPAEVAVRKTCLPSTNEQIIALSTQLISTNSLAAHHEKSLHHQIQSLFIPLREAGVADPVSFKKNHETVCITPCQWICRESIVLSTFSNSLLRPGTETYNNFRSGLPLESSQNMLNTSPLSHVRDRSIETTRLIQGHDLNSSCERYFFNINKPKSLTNFFA
jgi:hypothetical protein